MKKKIIAVIFTTLFATVSMIGCRSNYTTALSDTGSMKTGFIGVLLDGINKCTIATVKDIENNVAEMEIKNISLDMTAPVIVVEDITIKVNDDIDLMDGITATDDVDGDLTNKVAVTGTVDTTKEGAYKVTYKVADAAGNEAVAERTVVVEKKAPTKKCKTTTGGTITEKGDTTTGTTGTTTGGNSGTVATPTNSTPASTPVPTPAPELTPIAPTSQAPSDPPMVDPNPPTSDLPTDPEFWDDILTADWENIIIV